MKRREKRREKKKDELERKRMSRKRKGDKEKEIWMRCGGGIKLEGKKEWKLEKKGGKGE